MAWRTTVRWMVFHSASPAPYSVNASVQAPKPHRVGSPMVATLKLLMRMRASG